ncbi:MAG: serine/threonine-protein phosphatase [Synechococcaceae cyanobacterium RL_1_2]|nr:serine/threonine-protein phosphatase [Synechococcaceae cyanobacterium RL_1_2]
MTDMGVKPKLNEDSLFPQPSDFASNGVQPNYLLLDHLAIVCDGIAGHEGGEVASQLAVESIKLQVKGLLAEIALETEIITPQLMAQQIEAIVKVANNLIVSRNDARQRSARQRMGTTLVMALQLPQEVPHPDTGYQNSHELYIAWVGDSRAYWLTPDYCQLLTVDDDMAKREITAGKTTASHISQRPDATALTQALGIKDGEQLKVNVIRFVIPEDGILLLCSDGLTDFGIVETEGKSWADSIMAGVNSLEVGVKSIVEQAKVRNLDDNITAVASYYQVSAPYPLMVNLEDELMPLEEISSLTPSPEQLELATLPTPPEPSMEQQFAQAYLEEQQQLSNATMDDRLEEELAKIKETRSPLLKVALISVGLLVIAGLTSLSIQWLMNPKSQTPNNNPNEETLGN